MIRSEHFVRRDKFYYFVLTFFTTALIITPLIISAMYHGDIVGRALWITSIYYSYLALSGIAAILNLYFAWEEWRDHLHCRERGTCCALVRMVDYLKEMWWTYIPPITAGVILVTMVRFGYSEVRYRIEIKRYCRKLSPWKKFG